MRTMDDFQKTPNIFLAQILFAVVVVVAVWI